jgi:uncharacterized oxidoreductase
MRMHSNTILITGGSSGIGKGLAEAFHKLGNQVIISGRREGMLRDICAANPGMRCFSLDVMDPSSVRRVAAEVIKQFPQLNCVFNNAGVQKQHDFSADQQLDEQALLNEIHTNLLGVIRVAAAFVPHLKKRENAVLVNVSSGLAFVPFARYPVYCATKAAVHSLSLSLRHQLKGSRVKIIELIPPYVETELGGVTKANDLGNSGGPKPMPLDAFIAETMKELAGDADEVAIANAKNLMGASGPESVKKAFAVMNR